MKYKLKRLVSLISALVVMAVNMPVISYAETVGVNLAGDNAGFELKNLDGWTKSSVGLNIAVTSADKHSGGYSAIISNRTGNNDSPRMYVNIKPNTNYYISAWVKPVESGKQGRGQLKLVVGDNHLLSGPCNFTANTWTKVSGIVNTGNTTQTTAYMSVNTTTSGTAADNNNPGNKNLYVDDFEIYEVSSPSEIDENILTNASFEAVEDSLENVGWRNSSGENAFTRVCNPVEASHGNYYALVQKRTTNWSSPKQIVSIQPNTYYYIAADVQLGSQSASAIRAKTRMQSRTDGAVAITEPYYGSDSAVAYDKYTKIQKVVYNSNATEAQVYVQTDESIASGSTGADLKLDNFVVLPITASVENGASGVIPDSSITLNVPENIAVNGDTLKIDKGAEILNITRNGRSCVVDFAGMINGVTYTLSLNTGLNSDCTPKWSFTTQANKLEPWEPTFENGFNTTKSDTEPYWHISGSTSVRSNEKAHSGVYSVKVTKRTGNYAGPQAQNIQMLPGKMYYASAWVYTDGADKKAQLTYQGTAKTYRTGEIPLMKGGWTKVFGIINSEVAQSGKLFVQTNDSEDIYVDDFDIADITGITPESVVKGNLLENAGFETGEKTNWRETVPKYSVVRSADNANTGIYAAKTTARESAYLTPQQYVNITPDTYYYIRAFAKLASPATESAVAKMRLQQDDGKTTITIPGDAHNKQLNTNEYTKVSAVVYNKDSEYAKVYVNVAETEPYADLWTDDYAVVPITSSICDGATNIAPNSTVKLSIPEEIPTDTASFVIDGDAKIASVQRNGSECSVALSNMDYGTEYTLTFKTGLNMNPSWKFTTADGRLLTANSGFETGIGSWTIPESKFYYTTTEDCREGTRSLKILERERSYSSPHQYLNSADMVAGNTYTVAAWVKLSEGTDVIRLKLQMFDASGASLGSVNITDEDVEIGTDWTYIENTFVFEQTDFSSIKLLAETNGLNDIYFDEFEIWEGNKPETVVKPGTTQTFTPSGDVSVNSAIVSSGKDIAQLWDFSCTPSTPGLLAGWRMRVGTLDGNAHYPFKPEYQDGMTRLDMKLVTGGYMSTERYTDYGIDGSKYKYISIKAENLSSAKIFQIGFWTSDNRAEANRITKFIKWPEGEGVQEIVVDMSKCSAWTNNTISRIAFHPAKDAQTDEYGWAVDGESVLLRSISVFANEPAVDTSLTEEKITRGQFVDMLIDGLELNNITTSEESFDDVELSDLCYESVVAAEEMEIVSSENKSFNPYAFITREDAAVMLMKACDYLDKQTNRYIKPAEFSDVSEFSDGTYEAASFAVNCGFMSADGGMFNPKGYISASDAEAFVNNAVLWVNGTPADGSVYVSADTAGTYDIVRISACDTVNAVYTNAFDFDEVKADAVFEAPDGSVLTLPGFYDTLNDHAFDVRRTSKVISQDCGYWKFRFSPTMVGEWSFEIRLTYNGNTYTLGNGKIVAVETGRPGYLRRDMENPRFVYENGDAFSAIGINLKAPVYEIDEGGYEIFEDYLKKYADDNGINLIRTWLNAEDDKNLEDYQTGLGRFDGVHAQRLDYVYGLARQKGVSVLTNILSFHMLRSWNWLFSRGHYASIKDGVIEYGAEFYSDEECIKAYKSLLRYVIARYSAYDNVLLWEFLNEEEAIDGFNKNREAVSQWHDEMNAFVKAIDPYAHPVGSAGYTISGEDFLFSKESTDYTILHSYDTVQPSLMLRANAAIGTGKYNKPQIIEEMSLHAPDVTTLDPDGRSTHEILWGSLAAGHAAACPSWWWWPNEEYSEWGNNEGWAEPNEHWNIYGPVTSFLKDLNWPGENIRLVDFSATTSKTGDFIIPAGYKTYAQQKLSDYTGGKKTFAFDLSEETSNIREIDDIIYESNICDGDVYTFKINNLKKAANFVVTTIGKPTTAYAGGKLEIYVDPYRLGNWLISNPKYTYNITDESLNDYIKKHVVSLSKGSHSIEIHYSASNGSPCWLGWVGVEDVVPRIVAEGAVGTDNAVIYVRDTKAVYSEIIAEGYDNAVIDDAKVDLDLSNLNDGRYKLVWWDTYKGGEISEQEFTVINGTASVKTVNVPQFTGDIAAKIIPVDTNINMEIVSFVIDGKAVEGNVAKPGTAQLVCRVTNKLLSPTAPAAIAVLYNSEGKMLDFDIEKAASDISVDGYAELPLKISIPETAINGNLKIMVWEDITTVKPLEKPDEYTVAVK